MPEAGGHGNIGPRRRRRERGAATIYILAIVFIGMMGLTVAAFALGRGTVEGMRAQAQADALALGSSVITRMFGADAVCQPGRGLDMMTALYVGNGGQEDVVCPVSVDPLPGRPVRAHTYPFELSHDATFGDFAGVHSFIRRSQVESIYEVETGAFTKNLSKLVFVLDFSRTMAEPFGGGGPRINALKSSVDAFGNRVENLRYGAVRFAKNVLNPVQSNLVEGNGPDVAGSIQNQDVARGADSATNYQAALNRASQVLDQDAVGDSYILFVSDGLPTASDRTQDGNPREVNVALATADGIAAANNAKDPNGTNAEIFGIYIGDADAAAEAAMQSVVTADDPADPDNRHLEFATNQAQLDAFFNSFVVNYICTIDQPLENLHEDFHRTRYPERETYVWLRPDPGSEGVPVQYTEEDLGSEGRPEQLFFRVQEEPAGSGEFRLLVSQRVCERMEDNGEELVIRYGYAHLVR